MSAKGELLDLLGKISNIISVYREDPEYSEFYDDEDVIESLALMSDIIETAFPSVRLSQDLIYGEITPAVFLKQWENVSHLANIEWGSSGDVEISPDVKKFLKKFGEDKPGDTV